MQIPLLNAEAADKNSFVSAIHSFVKNVVSNEGMSVADADDKSFASLVELALSLNLTEEQQKQLNDDVAAWDRGYSKLVSEYGLPDNGKKFVLAVSVDSAASVSNADLNTRFATEPRIVYATKSQFDSIYRLGIVNFNAALRSFVDEGFSQDDLFEKYVLANDPFDNKALFKSLISRDTFGVTTDLSGTDLLILDASVSFAGGKIDLEKWQKAVAYFGKADFTQDGINVSHFSVIPDATQTSFQLACDGVINSEKKSAVLSVDGNDGFLRVFKRSAGDSGTVTMVTASQTATSYEKFIMVEAKDFYECVTKARASWVVEGKEDEIIGNYEKAMFAVKTQQDLDWMAEELIRFVVSKKVDKNVWAAFLTKTDVVKNVRQLIKKFNDTFVKFEGRTIKAVISNLLVKQVHYDQLTRQDKALAGTLAPKFLQNIAVEPAVLSFSDTFENLKTRLNDLTGEGVAAFMTDVQALLVRKVEVVLEDNLSSSTYTSNTSDDALATLDAVADWLELVCAENSVLSDSGNKQKCLDFAAILRTTFDYAYPPRTTAAVAGAALPTITTRYCYSDLVVDLAGMVDNIPGFSPDRANLFLKQAAKLVHPLSLTMALSDSVSLSDSRKAIRQVMSNQMAVISKSAIDSTAEPTPRWLGTIKGTGASNAVTYGDYLNKILNLLVYPLGSVKGQAFIDLVAKTLTTMKGLSASDHDKIELSANQLYDVVQAWDGCIGSAIVKADVLSMTTYTAVTDTNFSDAVFSNLKRKLATSLVGLIKSAAAFLLPLGVSKAVTDKYDKLAADITTKAAINVAQLAIKSGSATTTPVVTAATSTPVATTTTGIKIASLATLPSSTSSSTSSNSTSSRAISNSVQPD
jgi:hypothetical protein